MPQTPIQVQKILLVYPQAPQDSYWSFSHSLRMIGKKANMPPLGLLTVAGMLPADRFQFRLVDMNVRELDDADIAWADTVFTSAMIVQQESLEAVIRRVKNHGKPVVAGGPYPSTAYRDTADVDCFLLGEAETIGDVFLTDLLAGQLRPAYGGLVRAEEAEAAREYFGPEAHIEQVTTYPDLNLAPLPRFDLLRMADYAVMPIQASRGCPVGCEFCDIWRRFGRRSRTKQPSRILAELDELYRLGWRDAVFIVDDNFIGDKARAMTLLDSIHDWQTRHRRPFSFLTEATLSLADDDAMLERMAAVGFTSVFVGIETPCAESLKETRKHINTIGSIADKVAKIQATGIEIMSGFILGFDADPDDIADQLSACIQEMGIPQAMIGLLTALPDTDLHDRLEREGRIRGRTSGNNTHAFALNFQPARPEQAILADYRRILETAYPRDMREYFQRCAVLRDRWPRRHGPGGGQLSVFWKVRAVANCLRTVLTSEYRRSALRFLAETMWRKPSFFEQAITLCVKGHHFWAITGQAFAAEEMRQFMTGRLKELTDFLGGHGPAGTAVSAYMTDMFRESERYRKRMLRETERKYRQLSRETRRLLADELERFRLELNALCRDGIGNGLATRRTDGQ
ncbi:MAG: B12-binding domain-containing radical SAM protein [Planctomycetes bacterium]|nr:B12-binding domain-containing radical SAM protein [Planctomycetota bacterium]